MFKLFNVLVELLKSELAPRPEIQKLLKPKVSSDTRTANKKEMSMSVESNITQPEINNNKPSVLGSNFSTLFEPYREKEVIFNLSMLVLIFT